jgi:anti-sigma B factor antagonist
MTQTPLWTSLIGSDNEIGTVSLAGEIDMAAADSVHALLIGELDQPGTTVLSANLKELTFIDSTGVGALINAYAYALGAGKTFRVTNASGAVARVMKITGVYSLLIGTEDELGEGPI